MGIIAICVHPDVAIAIPAAVAIALGSRHDDVVASHPQLAVQHLAQHDHAWVVMEGHPRAGGEDEKPP